MILLAAALAATSATPLRLATYAYPAYDRREALAPLARLIEAETGRPVEISLLGSPEELATALRERRVDIAMTNLAAYLQAASEPAIRPIAMLDVPPQTLEGYRGVLLARRAAGLTTLADAGAQAPRLRYMEVLPGSTSGALVQAAALRGVASKQVRFRSVVQAGTHDKALAALLSDDGDVAALAEGHWRALQHSDPAGAARLVELWRSDPLPPGPIVCVQHARTPCDRIGARLLSGGAHMRTAAAALAKGWSETAGALSFTRVRPNTYRAFSRDSISDVPFDGQE